MPTIILDHFELTCVGVASRRHRATVAHNHESAIQLNCDRTPQLTATSPTAKCQQARCLTFRTASP
ncbi:MAG TPA: hypothetical protein VK211_04490, partial [Kamptonema sp.]|nr:hypothetical protein [Kamptonema sp.]